MIGEPPHLVYERCSIALPAAATRRDTWGRLGTLPGLVAVNLIDADGVTTLLSDDAIDTALASRPTRIDIDALPEARYLEIAESTLQQALASAAALRRTLAAQAIPAATEELQAFLGRLNGVLALVALAAHPRADLTLTRPLALLAQQAQQLAASAFQLDDAVRAMDDVHYEIAPTLTTLLLRLRSDR